MTGSTNLSFFTLHSRLSCATATGFHFFSQTGLRNIFFVHIIVSRHLFTRSHFQHPYESQGKQNVSAFYLTIRDLHFPQHVQSVVQRVKIFCLSDISPASVFSYVITPWFIHRIGLISLKARHDKHLVLCFLCTKSNMISLPPYIIR